ncbi:MAG: DUF975 family protein, partial [Acidimicrobiia bacterium]|nr:DUF975 family protein [Acidimicrobiia bacterium]
SAPGSGAAFNVGDAITYGWNAYWKNVGPLVLITLVIFGVQVLISIVGSGTNGAIAAVVLQLLSFVVGIILAMGLIRASLAVCEGRKPEVSMLLETDGFFNYLVAAILFGVGVFFGLVLCIIPGIILAVVFQFFGYAIVQHPELGAVDALKRSADITKGYRWQLFGLALFLILINLVGLLACGVGLLFTYGISAIAIAYAYKTLSGQAVAAPA